MSEPKPHMKECVLGDNTDPGTELIPPTSTPNPPSSSPNIMSEPEPLGHMEQCVQGDCNDLITELPVGRPGSPGGCLEISMWEYLFLLEMGQCHPGEITSLRLYNCWDKEIFEVFEDPANRMTSLRKLDMHFCGAGKSSQLLVSEPFCKINNLTKFYFKDGKFAAPLDTLLPFLRGNPLLEEVQLWVGVDSSTQELTSQQQLQQAPVHLKRLRSLNLGCRSVDGIKFLISHIPLKRGVELWTYSSSGCYGDGLYYVLRSIEGVERTPTRMHVIWTLGGELKISGPNGSLYFNLSKLDIQHSLEGDGPISLKEVQDLKFTSPPMPLSLKSLLSPFPALKVFTVDGDKNISATLSEFFSSQELVSRIDRLEIKEHYSSEGGLLINWEQPQFLRVWGHTEEAIENLLTNIPLPNGTKVERNLHHQ